MFHFNTLPDHNQECRLTLASLDLHEGTSRDWLANPPGVLAALDDPRVLLPIVASGLNATRDAPDALASEVTRLKASLDGPLFIALVEFTREEILSFFPPARRSTIEEFLTSIATQNAAFVRTELDRLLTNPGGTSSMNWPDTSDSIPAPTPSDDSTAWPTDAPPENGTTPLPY